MACLITSLIRDQMMIRVYAVCRSLTCWQETLPRCPVGKICANRNYEAPLAIAVPHGTHLSQLPSVRSGAISSHHQSSLQRAATCQVKLSKGAAALRATCAEWQPLHSAARPGSGVTLRHALQELAVACLVPARQSNQWAGNFTCI